MYSAIALAVSTLALRSAAAPSLVERNHCPNGGCSFTLSVDGMPVEFNAKDQRQLAYGGSMPGGEVSFCIDNNGQITDSAGTCGITQNSGKAGQTSQFQCDASSPSTFTINCMGYLEYMGSDKFYSCVASKKIGSNIYATPPSDAACASGSPKEIMLKASGCYSQCPAPKPAPKPSPKPAPKPQKCPGMLKGEWQYPHLIVPISKSHPNKAYGTSYDGKVNSDMSSIFNFDVPMSYSGMMCKMVFDFPTHEQMPDTSSWTMSSPGMMDWSMMSSPATQSTTYNNCPSSEHMASHKMMPGSSYTMWEGECPAGEKMSMMMSTNSNMDMWFFQDYNPCPIGMYMMAYD